MDAVEHRLPDLLVHDFLLFNHLYARHLDGILDIELHGNLGRKPAKLDQSLGYQTLVLLDAGNLGEAVHHKVALLVISRRAEITR